ncbi:MAG: DEAD/DEAH box helicase [Anaerolineae bacterium]
MTQTFESLGIRPEVLRAVADSGYTTPTPIQEQTIPLLLAGRDVLGQAQTGTGKTAAFSLPMLTRFEIPSRHIVALVLTPTRELATQVSNAIFHYGQYMGARVLPIYGGQSYERQHRRLEKGADVVVATPGRLIDLMNQKVIDLSHVQYLVLDEADEMLKMGFIEDVETIIRALPTQRQTALFSATLPEEIRRIARNYMSNPEQVTIAKQTMTVATIEQRYYLVHPDSKIPALSRLLETEDMQSALIFTRTRADSAELADALIKRGYLADSISGDLSQDAREAVLRRFRNGDLPILVATDVVARGVDIPAVSHVFNFDMPQDDEDYVHRIGRTGRAGRSGTAITLVTPKELRRLQYLERFIKQTITRAELPRLEDIRARRDAKFVQKLEELIVSADNADSEALVQQFLDNGYNIMDVASAALQLARLDEMERPVDHVKAVYIRDERPERRERGDDRRRGDRFANDTRNYRSEGPRRDRFDRGVEAGMTRLTLDIGKNDNIRPADVVGTIASYSGIPGKLIGAIRIKDDFTTVDIPQDAVEQVLRGMKRAKMRGKAVKAETA